ncbi:DUF6257 family protein [Streptomyces sp. WAC 04229]|uniref:DUF6257 family protein n=1 Tax=Streptomyces sp. WAC 04229 TaxID=2203206 RepID=UPI00163C141F|nr:DUF6257 family protein [Streptomyces sp. WAC 04229]
MAHDVRFSDFTRGEKARIAAKTARMTMPRANITKLRRDIERIEQQAAKRKNGK